MARQPSRFKQREVSRLLRAAKAAGVEVDRVEIDTDGKIVVHLLGSGDGDPKLNTADAVLEKLKYGHRKS
jgi:hypothetical protein